MSPTHLVAGYEPPESGLELATRQLVTPPKLPFYEVIDPFAITDELRLLNLVFNDSLKIGTRVAYGYNIVDKDRNLNLFADPQKLVSTNGVVFNGVRLSIDTTYQKLIKYNC